MITACMSGGTLQKMLSTGVNDLKMLQECAFYFVLYMNVLLLFFSVVCASLKKGTKAEKIVFTISMLFTVPFLYQYERGNIIFLALCFTMLFFPVERFGKQDSAGTVLFFLWQVQPG